MDSLSGQLSWVWMHLTSLRRKVGLIKSMLGYLNQQQERQCKPKANRLQIAYLRSCETFALNCEMPKQSTNNQTHKWNTVWKYIRSTKFVFNPTFRNQHQINWKNHTNVLMGFTTVLADVNVHGNQRCIAYFEDPDSNSVWCTWGLLLWVLFLYCSATALKILILLFWMQLAWDWGFHV